MMLSTERTLDRDGRRELEGDFGRLDLLELLEFRADEGVIRLFEQRMIVQGAAAMGLLRKALIETLEIETARRLLLRFGYADGYHDAVSLRDHFAWDDPLQGLLAGIRLHTLEGIVRSEPRRLEYDEITGAFDAEIVWQHSYEGEQHLHQLGRSPDPVCWTLVGYISGYASACLGQDVFFRETQCVAAGARECVLTGRHAAGWGEDLAGLQFDFKGADLRAEVERLRDVAHRQRERLARRERALTELESDLHAVRERVRRFAESSRFIVRDPAMTAILEMAARVAPLETTALIHGETGTGKEFIARMIHAQSERASGPLVSVNCAALTETLLESELFGHVRGAFTGAVRDKPGLFEVASEGTLFLDEIGEMAPTLQAKLLRALQTGELRRVGSERAVQARPRIIAATNRDLRSAVRAGQFREDLYFRISAFIITVPPLRERRQDIPVLVHEFVRQSSERLRRRVRRVSRDAMSTIMAYGWPGNVRELEHAIERALIVAPGPAMTALDLPPEVREGALGGSRHDDLNLRSHERTLILRALDRHGGNRRQAAAALGISPVTLWRRIREYDLTRFVSD